MNTTLRPSALVLFMSLLLTSCGHSDRFNVELNADGLGSQSVTMTYYARGAVNTVNMVSDEQGHVSFTGDAPDPTLAELCLTASGKPVATLIVENGDDITVRMTMDNPAALSVDGTDENRRLAAFMNDNADAIRSHNAARVNAAIKAFILANPRSTASTALLVTRFHIEGYETLADSLLNVIDPAARPIALIENFNSVMASRATDRYRQPIRSLQLFGAADSVYSYVTFKQSYTLMAFVDRHPAKTDSVARILEEIASRFPASKVRVLEISLSPDSAAWHRAVKSDSARRDRAWARGAAASLALERLNIPATPYFIIGDSTGVQLYRSASVTNASQALTAAMERRRH